MSGLILMSAQDSLEAKKPNNPVELQDLKRTEIRSSAPVNKQGESSE